MSRFKGKKTKIRPILYNHIKNNKREYVIVTILFFIGLVLAAIFVNNYSDQMLIEINTYLNQLFNNIRNSENLNLLELLKDSILKNITITVLLWFGASTIIGIPIVYGTIILKGFSIGYTISCLLTAFGIWKGLGIAISIMLLHNIILLPTVFVISVSGVKLYKSIMQNKQRENIKIEILRHTLFCFIMLIGMFIASLIEVYLSTNISVTFLKYIKM